jgi:hypothetical protein
MSAVVRDLGLCGYSSFGKFLTEFKAKGTQAIKRDDLDIFSFNQDVLSDSTGDLARQYLEFGKPAFIKMLDEEYGAVDFAHYLPTVISVSCHGITLCREYTNHRLYAPRRKGYNIIDICWFKHLTMLRIKPQYFDEYNLWIHSNPRAL